MPISFLCICSNKAENIVSPLPYYSVNVFLGSCSLIPKLQCHFPKIKAEHCYKSFNNKNNIKKLVLTFESLLFPLLGALVDDKQRSTPFCNLLTLRQKKFNFFPNIFYCFST